MKPSLLTACLLVGVIPICGCGDGKKVDAVPVNGKLFVDGQPYGPATIVLQPVDRGEDSLDAAGDVADDGTFTLHSGKDIEGAVPGKYKVVVSEDVMSGKGVPQLEPITVEIQKPDDGGAVTLEIQAKSSKGGKLQAGPGTDDDPSQSTGTGLVP